jgi:hypothetical protein
MRLFNVRVGPEEARMIEQLRRQGRAVSRIVRRAIREEYERGRAADAARLRPREIMAAIYREIPDPPAPALLRADLRDRRSVRRRIRARLRRRP